LEQNDLSKGRLTYSFTELDATFREGDTFTVKVTPEEGCTLKSIKLNGEVLTADSEGNYLITIEAKENILVVEYDGEPIKPPIEEPPIDVTPPDGSNDGSADGSMDDNSGDITPPTSSSSNDATESGCGSSLSGMLGTAFMLVIVATAIVIKKKNINKEIKLCERNF
jgi:hypothetical protein